MLDINDFVTERGGDVKKIKESQKARYAPEELVDEVYQMYEDHRRSTHQRLYHLSRRHTNVYLSAKYEADQLGAKINTVQKEIGQKKKARTSL